MVYSTIRRIGKYISKLNHGGVPSASLRTGSAAARGGMGAAKYHFGG